MTTKPFDPSKPAQTRDGRPVRILCTDAKGVQPILGLLMAADVGVEIEFRWNADGSFVCGGEPRHIDLINVPTKRKGWIGVRSISDHDCLIAHSSDVYPSEDDARSRHGRTYSQFIEIEFGE